MSAFEVQEIDVKDRDVLVVVDAGFAYEIGAILCRFCNDNPATFALGKQLQNASRRIDGDSSVKIPQTCEVVGIEPIVNKEIEKQVA